MNKQTSENVDYKSIFDSYKNTDHSGRGSILSDADKKYGLAFDPEEILEMIVDEIKEQHQMDQAFQNILNSSTLQWHEIASEIKHKGFNGYSELMLPAIAACDYGEEGVVWKKGQDPFLLIEKRVAAKKELRPPILTKLCEALRAKKGVDPFLFKDQD